jgi:hypothetical protein
MNLEADSGTARSSEIYNQAHAGKDPFTLAPSRLDVVASLLSQRLIASTYLGNKKPFVGDIFIAVSGARWTDFSLLASHCSSNEPGCVTSFGASAFAQGLSKSPLGMSGEGQMRLRIESR